MSKTGPIEQLRHDYQQLLRRMEANQRQFDLLARSAFRLQEEERRRLARDLHDGLGQNLTALQHLLGLLLQSLPSEAERSHALTERALGICRRTLEDTREMSRLLRPQILDDLGLSAALRALCRDMREHSHLNIELRIDDEPELSSEQQTVLYRVVQEALTNTVRHAKASQVSIHLREVGHWLNLVIEDDGIGLTTPAAQPANSRHGSGLGGMRERVRLLGGELRLQAAGASGLRLHVLLPLDGPPTPAAE